MRYLVIPFVMFLAACSGGKGGDDASSRRDPVAAAALDDPLGTDPDLTGQNRGNAALDGGVPDGALPDFKRSPEEVAAAKAEAERLLGKPIPAAPDPVKSTKTSRLVKALTMQAIVDAAGLGGGCSGKMDYSFAWAARLPTALPVYPRGHALMAGGSDQPGCKLRAVRYVTPVEPGDVIAFNLASANAVKLSAQHSREGEDDVLTGKGFALFARKRDDGLTEVDLVTSGL